MAHLALYRAWRPQNFEDVIGQEHITQTLKNALSEKRFSHAYLFSGPRGTGKTSTAKIFAKAVNCQQDNSSEPCNDCKICKGITEGFIMDVVEIDAASNRGVEEIRDLREKVKFAPTETKYKVYIIDEVHMLTTEAFNALLKTLEEPPQHVIFILATTEPHKLPLTIISRCQRFDFRRITSDKIVELLHHVTDTEDFKIEKEALSLIAKYAEGGMRDALSLLDQVLSFSGTSTTVDDVLRITGRVSRESFSNIVVEIYNKKTAEVLTMIDELIREGKEPERIIEDLLYYYRDLLLYNSAPKLEEIREKVITDETMPSIAKIYTEKQLYLIIDVLNHYLHEMKNINQPRLILELAVIKITNLLAQDPKEEHIPNKEISLLKERINELEQRLEHFINNDSQRLENSITVEKKQISSKKTNNNPIFNDFKNLNEKFSNENLDEILQIWPKVLSTIKEKKITVHAWLIDGEPVAVTEEKVILAFNNIMHRDTTDKPVNKQLIEDVINELLTKTYSLLNIMQKDWRTYKEGFNEKTEETIKVNLNPEENSDKFTEKAIEIFGKDLVEIKD